MRVICPVHAPDHLGSGHDMLGLEATAKEVIELTGKNNPRVLYLGTATYDNPSAMDDQTKNFRSLGCSVTALNISHTTPSPAKLRAAFADTGCNTHASAGRLPRTIIFDYLRR